MTWIKISPNDVWMFRDGKPFSATESHIAESLFPPAAWTVQGALRAMIAANQGVGLTEYKEQSTDAAKNVAGLIGVPNAPVAQALGQFRMSGPFLAGIREGQTYRFLPAPADLVYDKARLLEEDDTPLRILQPIENHFVAYVGDEPAFDYQNQPALLPLDVNEDEKSVGECWLREDYFARYLQKEPMYAHYCTKKSSLYGEDHRFGVGIDYTTSYRREGLLYSAEFIRPADGVGLMVDLPDELPVPDKGMLGIGGEGRAAHFEKLPAYAPEPLHYTNTNHFKVVFLTPAYLAHGWYPSERNWSQFFGTEVRLVSAALKRPQRIGGWDSRQHHPRRMYSYVAPGSVYYFETVNVQAVNLNSTSITETPANTEDHVRLGFGQVAIGIW